MATKLKMICDLKIGDRVVWWQDDCVGLSWDGYEHNKIGYKIFDIFPVPIDNRYYSLLLETKNGTTRSTFSVSDTVFKVITQINRNLPDWF